MNTSDPVMRQEVAAGATVDATARKHETTRAVVVQVVGVGALVAGYVARYRASWGEDPRPVRRASEPEIRASVRRVLGRPLGKRPMGRSRGRSFIPGQSG